VSEKPKRTLLRGGYVVTMDDDLGDIENGDVVLAGDQIEAVGSDLQVDVDETVLLDGKLVLPGLIDSHIHLWQSPLGGLGADCWGMEYFPTIHPYSGWYRPEDLYAATLGGALASLARGVTTVFDFCHSIHSPDHADAAVKGLDEAGVRALFGYSLRHRPDAQAATFGSHADRVEDAHRVASDVAPANHGLVRTAIAMNNLEQVDAETTAVEVETARELGVMATVHSIFPGQVLQLEERGLLGPDLQLVHCTAISDEELEVLAARGGWIAVAPEVEAGLMSSTPVLGRALRLGVPVGLGVDVPSGVAIDLLAQMRFAFTVDRFLDAQSMRLAGHEPRRTTQRPTMSPDRVLRLCTTDAAMALGLGDSIGSLTPGKSADVTVFSTGPFGLGGADPRGFLLSQLAGADVHSVYVAGRPRVLEGSLVGIPSGHLEELAERVRDRVLGHGGVAERVP
jgi:5-methylthioadenosine/S-adenosylhomocysteine deaminase